MKIQLTRLILLQVIQEQLVLITCSVQYGANGTDERSEIGAQVGLSFLNCSLVGGEGGRNIGLVVQERSDLAEISCDLAELIGDYRSTSRFGRHGTVRT